MIGQLRFPTVLRTGIEPHYPLIGDSSGCVVADRYVFLLLTHLSVWYSYVRASWYNSKLRPTRCNVSWFIYSYRPSICFRRFLPPSSGAHNCTYSFRYCQPLLLLAAIVDEKEPATSSSSTKAASSSIGWQYLKEYVVCPKNKSTVFPKYELKNVAPRWCISVRW